jgi:hypothetical protein
MRIVRCSIAVLLLILLGLAQASAQAVTTRKILNNGPDGDKLVFAVVGDGYSAADQTKYAEDVDRLVINGVMAHDFYSDNRSAFNVYRVDLVSADSGVSKPGAPKNTRLKTVYTGDWNRCWIEPSNDTETLLNDALANVPKYDFVLVVQNESGFGGCRRGSRLYVTGGVGWDVVAHEWGHGIGGLFDEYSVNSRPLYVGPQVNVRNCSTVLDGTQVAWTRLIQQGFVIPPSTQFGGGIDPNITVGMFQGCATYMTGIYRPVHECRMNTNTPHFCPVCLGLMNAAVAPFLGPNPAGPANGAANGTHDLHQALFVNASFAAGYRQTPTPPQSNSFLQVVVHLKKGGSATPVKITEVEGILPQQDQQASSSVVEATSGAQTLGVQFLQDDPFTVRGFTDPNNPERGELFEETDEATVVIRVPRADLNLAATGPGVSLKLYEVKPASSSSLYLDPNAIGNFEQLKSQKVLEEQTRVPANRLKDSVKKRVDVRAIQ